MWQYKFSSPVQMLIASLICLVSCTKRTFESISNGNSAHQYGDYSELKPKELLLSELESELAPQFPHGLLPRADELREQMQSLLRSPQWNPILARWLWLNNLSYLNRAQAEADAVIMDFFERSVEQGDLNLLKDLVDYSPSLFPYAAEYVRVFLNRYGLRHFYPHYPEDLLAAVDKWNFRETDPWYLGLVGTFQHLIPLLSDYPMGHIHRQSQMTWSDQFDLPKLAIELHSYLITHPEDRTLNILPSYSFTYTTTAESIRLLVGAVKTYGLQESGSFRLMPAWSKALWPFVMENQVPSLEVIRMFLGGRENDLQQFNGNISSSFVFREADVSCGFVHWLLTAHRDWILEHRELISLPLWLQTAALYPHDAQFITLPAVMPHIHTLIPPTSTPGHYPAKLAPYFEQLLKYYPREALEAALQGHAHQASLVAILRLLDPTYFCGDLARAHAELGNLMEENCRGEWFYHFMSVNDPIGWINSLTGRKN